MDEKGDDFWEPGAFVERIDPSDTERMKTFHKGHDEDVNYDCKKCGKKISAHNKDWHGHMCDDCHFKMLS